MAALTRADIETIAKGLLDAKGVVRFDDTTFNALADLANRKVWRLLVRASIEHFAVRSTFTWPASTYRIDLTGASYLNAHAYKVLQVEETSSSGDPGSGNVPSNWLAVRLQELPNYHESPYYGSSGRVAYAIAGDYMYVAPVPGNARNVAMTWVQPLAALSGDSTEVLGGLAEDFGDHVAICLAYLLNAKQGGSNKVVPELWGEAMADLKATASARQMQRPAFVRQLRRD